MPARPTPSPRSTSDRARAALAGRLDWGFISEPEPGLGGQRCYLPRGRVLGGSSSLNAMLYLRGNRADYDGWVSWASPVGVRGSAPYFKRAEDNEWGESAYHGAGGPLAVSDGAPPSLRCGDDRSRRVGRDRSDR